jgi:hypothetical protein
VTNPGRVIGLVIVQSSGITSRHRKCFGETARLRSLHSSSRHNLYEENGTLEIVIENGNSKSERICGSSHVGIGCQLSEPCT